MAGPRKVPKYKQPLQKGLPREQVKVTLRKNTKMALGSLERSAEAKGSGRFRLGVRTGRSALIDNRFLHTCLAKSKFAENQVVAEKLLRVRFEIMEHFDIPEGNMETLDNILENLKRAEDAEKRVSLDPHQIEILEKYFKLV